jgi:BolA protein
MAPATPMSSEERARSIRMRLERELAPLHLTVRDDGAKHVGHAGAREGGHFQVDIVSEQFRGRSRLERHRLVYEALGELMGTQIHALAVNAQAPEERTS